MLLYLVNIFILFIMILGYELYCLFKERDIRRTEKNYFINSGSFDKLRAPFFYIVAKNFKFFNRFVGDRVKLTLRNIYSESYLKYYQINFVANKLFVFYYTCIVFLILSTIGKEIMLDLIGILFLFFLNIYFNKRLFSDYKNKKDEFKERMGDFISRLTLLLKAGMNLRGAIKAVCKNDNSGIGLSFKMIDREVNSGLKEEEAYRKIMLSYEDPLIRRLFSNISNNLQKGGSDIVENLLDIRRDAQDFRRANIIERCQRASQKLLIPNMIVFIAIMLLVMLPVLIKIV